MDYESVISTIEREAGVPHEQAEEIACTTLETLARRLSAGEAADIAEKLPEPLRTCAQPDGPRETFHLDEFLRRLQERLSVDRDTAERDALGVFAAVYAAVGPEEFHDMRSELPKDFHPLLSEAIEKAPQWEEPDRPFIGRFAYDELVERVASLAEVDRDQARTVAEAVLEVLAMRVTGGQVDDLEPYLPPQLRPALRRGRARTQGRALPLSLDEFVEEVMKLEGVTKEEATAHVRAVLAVLRSAVAEKEWRDTVEQLPMDFRMLLHQL